MLEKHDDDSLNAKGRIGDKVHVCLVTIDTGAFVRPDITAGLPERDLATLYILQIASREIFPILNEALVKLILGRAH
jgi:hypothetical protein